MKRRPSIVIALLVLAIIVLASSHAAQPSPHEPNPRPENTKPQTTNTTADLIRDFLTVAISRHGWLDDAQIDIRDLPLRPVGNPDATKTMHPIVSEYLWRTKGHAKPQAITKWTQPITVAVGWPRIMLLDEHTNTMREVTVFGFGQEKPDNTQYELFKDQITLLLPTLRSLTGLQMTFVEASDPDEVIQTTGPKAGTASHARIRVVPTRLVGTRTWLPSHGHTIEPYFQDGVAFTPFEIGQVDGYLLPEADNSIGYVVCRINPDLAGFLVRALISECLVRGLGLPELSQSSNEALVGPWNRRIADHAAERVQQETDKQDQESRRTWPTRNDGSQFGYPDELVDTHDLEKGPSPYDELMLRLLYCPDIKPGMDSSAVASVLERPNHCIKDTPTPERSP